MTVVLIVTPAIFAVKLRTGHQVVTAPTLAGADLPGAFVLEVTIALSLRPSLGQPPSTTATSAGEHLAHSGFRLHLAGLAVAHRGAGDRGGWRGQFTDRRRRASGRRSWVAGCWGAGADRGRAQLGGLQRDERLQRIAGVADRRGRVRRPVSAVGGGHGVRVDHVAAPGDMVGRSRACCCSSATDSGIRRDRGHRLALPQCRARRGQPGGGEHRSARMPGVALGCSWSRSPRRCRSCTPT